MLVAFTTPRLFFHLTAYCASEVDDDRGPTFLGLRPSEGWVESSDVMDRSMWQVC